MKTEGDDSTFLNNVSLNLRLQEQISQRAMMSIVPTTESSWQHGLTIDYNGLTDYGRSLVIRDPMDKRFDLEAYLNVVAAESEKA